MLKKKSINSNVSSHVTIANGKTVSYEKGEPLEFNANKVIPPIGYTVVGLSKGITKNLGDYESARVDCWMSHVVKQADAVQALEDMSTLIDETIDSELTAIAKALRRK
jgi:hypothetical protein